MLYELEEFYTVVVVRIGFFESEIINEYHRGTFEEADRLRSELEGGCTKCLIAKIE